MTGPHASACLDEDAALAFLRHPTDERSASTDAHLAQCADCRRLLLELARSSSELSRSEAPAGPTALTPTSADRLDLRDPAQRYTLLEPLGAGGMGVVHVAYDAKLDRRVALKLMRLELAHETTGERLVREATTLARLSHPNIVVVYDVGRLGDQVYIAMELIEGTTLRGWLEEQAPRSWREVLRRLLDAGRGLATAHRAGVIHRDFKPENVLVSNEGRVCVTDFGLARLSADKDGASHVASAETLIEDTSLTQTGALVGTPAYLAPEVFAGAPATELSDQFSFCVTLYESLYGARPFRAANMDELTAAVAKGRVEAPPRDAVVPQWLRQRLLRGLSLDPANRYPDLDALLADLERDPARRLRRGVLTVGGLVAVAGAFALGGALGGDEPRCERDSPALTAAWGPDTRASVEAAFTRVERPYAASAWTSTARILDRYADDWKRERFDACTATHGTGQQSEALLDLRMRCLNKRLTALRVTAALLARADEDLVSRAVDVAGALPNVSDCGDTATLQSVVPLPGGTGIRAQVEQIEQEIAEATALRIAGELDRAAELATELVPRAKELGHDPLIADALVTYATVEHAQGRRTAAEEGLREAVLVADRGHHDAARADALLMMVWFVGADPERIEEAVALARRAEAVIGRLGEDEAELARLLDNLGVAFRTARRMDEALDHHRRALAIRRRILDDNDPELANTINNVGAVHRDLGELALAEQQFSEANRIWMRAYGDEHPQVAFALNNLAALASDREDVDAGIDYVTRAIDIREAALGPRHPDTAVSRLNRGLFQAKLGRNKLALADYESAHAVFAETLGDRHPYTIQALAQIGTVLVSLGELEAARERLVSARSLAGESPAVPRWFIEQSLGALSLAEERPAEALDHYQQSADLLRREPGGEDMLLVDALTGIGRAHLAMHEPSRAVEVLEPIVAVQTEAPTAADATAMYFLARALWENGEQRGRARELAAEARGHLAKLGHQDELIDQIDAWTADLPPP